MKYNWIAFLGAFIWLTEFFILFCEFPEGHVRFCVRTRIGLELELYPIQFKSIQNL